MSHQRTTIREALKTLLIGNSPTYGTQVGPRVFSNRNTPIPNSKLPALNIKSGAETATPRDVRSTQYFRKWLIKIEVILEDGTDYDTTLDEIAVEIEDILKTNRTLTATATTAVYIGTDEPEIDSSGEKPIVRAALNYEIQYFL